MTTRREFIQKTAIAGASLGFLGATACGDDGGPGAADALPDEGVLDSGSMLDARLPGEDARPPGEDARPPRMDARPPGEDARPPGEDARPPGLDARPPGEDARPPTMDARPPVVDARPPAADSSGGPMGVCRAVRSRISDNHGHTLVVPPTDIRGRVDKTYSIRGRAGHTHNVTVTVADFTELQSGRMVITRSTTEDRHAHEITLTCAGGIIPIP